jgi:arylsulfatase A-like enzyme
VTFLFPSPRRRDVFLIGSLALAACGEPELEPEPLENLLADTAIAEKHWPGTLLEFGSPAAHPFLGEGWSYAELGRDGGAFRWAVGEHAAFEFETAESGARTAWVECEPYPSPGGESQVIELEVNGKAVAPLTLRGGRSRYPVPLTLEPGRNAVRMRFASHRLPEEEPGGDRRKLAVAFHRWEIEADAEPRGDGRPGPFSIIRSRWGTAGLFLPAGASISYFVRLPSGARLVVQAGDREPRLLTPPGALLKVQVRPFEEDEADDGAEIIKTREAATPRGEVMELKLPLRRLAGKRARITLVAEKKALFVVPVLQGVSPAPPPTRLPPLAPVRNVLFIVLDGASALRMSAYGYGRPTTPVLERLAGESVVFETALTQAVYTIASVGSILTGEYPERHQSVSFADRLPASAVTLPGLLTLKGFRTAGFAGNAVVSSAFGLDRGYQEFYEVWKQEDYTGRGDSVTRRVLPWLERNRGGRFFAYVHFREPHFPYIPPPPYDRRFGGGPLFPDGIRNWETVESINRRAAGGEEIPRATIERIAALYDGNLAYVDAEVGKILRQLDALGLAGETAVIVTADHGEATFEHRYIGHNTQLYEESVRVPLLIRAPGLAPARVAAPVELLDLTPTVLELVGAGDHPVLGKMQGQSLLPLARGEARVDAEQALAFSRTLWAKPRYAARDARFKYIWDSRNGNEELYDLRVDPRESRNRSRERPLTTAFFRQQLFDWLLEQERLRSRTPSPESSEIPEELGRYLGGVGYFQYLKKNPPK